MPQELQLSQAFRALLSELIAVLSLRRVQAYATGGFIRDALLGKEVHDLDIAVSEDPMKLAPELAETFNGHFFALDEERGRVRVLLPAHDLHLDLTPLTGPIEDDLRQRDYTIDAIAAPLAEVAATSVIIIDPTGGLTDLEERTVRVVSEDALRSDPLRLLRGVRLAAQLDFRIEPNTAEMIRRHAGLLDIVSAERQRDELVQTLRTSRAAFGLRLTDELGLLERVVPEIGVTRGVEQPAEHQWDVFGHSLAAVEALDNLLATEKPADDPWASLWRELWSRLEWWAGAREFIDGEYVANTHRCSLIKLAGFLHDIGKPQTKSVDATGRMRFHGHADAGAEIAAQAMQRLRFSSRESELVSAMIDAHLRPLLLWQKGVPTRKAVYRFFRDTGEAGIDTLFLSLADHLATVGPRVRLDHFQRHVALVDYMLRQRFQAPEVIAPARLVDGDDLMAEFDLPAGPRLGDLLELVREAQAAGEVATREEALALARRELDGTGTPA